MTRTPEHLPGAPDAIAVHLAALEELARQIEHIEPVSGWEGSRKLTNDAVERFRASPTPQNFTQAMACVRREMVLLGTIRVRGDRREQYIQPHIRYLEGALERLEQQVFSGLGNPRV